MIQTRRLDTNQCLIWSRHQASVVIMSGSRLIVSRTGGSWSCVQPKALQVDRHPP